MTTRGLIAALALILAGCAEPSGPGPATLSPQQIIAEGTTDASGMPTYVVGSVAQEYEVLAALGREPIMQALVIDPDGTPYDIIETPEGPVRFDISSFFGQGF